MRLCVVFVIAGATMLSVSLHAKEMNNSICHLHPPGGELTEDVSQLPKFDDYSKCDNENRQRYSAMGRCHCVLPSFSGRRFPSFIRYGSGQGERGDVPTQ